MADKARFFAFSVETVMRLSGCARLEYVHMQKCISHHSTEWLPVVLEHSVHHRPRLSATA